MQRLFLQLAALNGFLAVALGAFGAHGLKGSLEGLEDSAQRLVWWETAAHYQLTHALALGLVGLLGSKIPGKLLRTGGWALQLGILLFSGSLYAMTLTGVRTLGAVTPFGGLAFLVGWICLLLAARRLPT
jgi:uncharacterized membrane protein YgdD (TMEM256/DUF423 family)